MTELLKRVPLAETGRPCQLSKLLSVYDILTLRDEITRSESRLSLGRPINNGFSRVPTQNVSEVARLINVFQNMVGPRDPARRPTIETRIAEKQSEERKEKESKGKERRER